MTPYESATVVVALVFGVVGSVTGIWSLVLTSRTHRQATERNDVVWEQRWEFPGTCVLTNIGGDVAHHVRATVTADGQRLVTEAVRVRAGDDIRIEFGRLAAQNARFPLSGSPNLDAALRLSPIIIPIRTEASMVWQTRFGTPHRADVEPAIGVPAR